MYMTWHAMASLNKANKHKQDTGMWGPPSPCSYLSNIGPGLVTVQRHGNSERVNKGQKHSGWLQISDTDVVRVHRLDTEEEFCHVVEHSPAEGVGVLTPSILQIIVSLIVEHLVGCQVHGSVQQSEAGEKPAKATEDERLNESNDVEQSPALHSNAVAGEEYGDGAIESHGESEDQEPASVPQSNTVVDVGTVVVKLSYTPVTDSEIIFN